MSDTSPDSDADEAGIRTRPLRIYSLGHSILGLEEFVELLRHYDIECLVDVRAIPRSRHNPQFDKETLSPFLRVRRIRYLHLKDLGGLRRHAGGDSPNAGWRNASFRGFADYMQTPAFTAALGRLLRLAMTKRTAIMCAESVPWRCHRSLIGDALVIRGVEVIDIFDHSRAKSHLINPMAKVDGTKITYPAPSTEEFPAADEDPKLKKVMGE